MLKVRHVVRPVYAVVWLSAFSMAAQGQFPAPDASSTEDGAPSTVPPVPALALDRAALDDTDPASSEETYNLFGLRAAPLTEPLVTDRPDFTESTDAVPWGHIQLEIGYTFTYDREDDQRTKSHAFPETLLRVGLIEDLELRIGWTGATIDEELSESRSSRGRRFTETTRDTGNGDLSLGFKYKFFEQDGLIPHFGAIAALTVPTGNATGTSGDVDPEVVLAWAYDITEWFAIAGNVLLAVPTSEKGRFFQSGASLTGAFALTDRLGMYIEYFGLYPSDRDMDAEHSLNGGFTYLLTENVQFDVLTGFGLNEQAPDFFTGAGISFRF